MDKNRKTICAADYFRDKDINHNIIDGECIINKWNKEFDHSPAQPSNTYSYHSYGDRTMARDQDGCYGERLVSFHASADDSKASVVSAGNS